jgi:hypothetical protein
MVKYRKNVHSNFESHWSFLLSLQKHFSEHIVISAHLCIRVIGIRLFTITLRPISESIKNPSVATQNERTTHTLNTLFGTTIFEGIALQPICHLTCLLKRYKKAEYSLGFQFQQDRCFIPSSILRSWMLLSPGNPEGHCDYVTRRVTMPESRATQNL